MDYNEIKEFVTLLDNTKFNHAELEYENVKLVLSNYTKENKEDVESLKETNKTILSTKEEVKKTVTGNLVKSPIVGTFYRSTSPNNPPFVSLGDKISKGDVLCIIEAMKVMNEITSPYDGIITEIYPENEQMVEYDQVLFCID